ncbi:MAG: molybdenum cofactor biosynthesis protein MoaE [Pseudomonadota bacterium]
MNIVVQAAAFDAGAALNDFAGTVASAGAIVSFTGVARDVPGGLLNMEIEHYPGMTEQALADIRLAAVARFNLTGARVIHRFGTIAVHDLIMMVMTAAPHRKDAFEGADFLMDYLKSRAPFWKREVTRAGAQWVASRSADEDALTRW